MGTVIEMKDNIYWLLAIIGLVLVFSGIAYIFLEMRRLGPYGGPTMLLGAIAVLAGLAISTIASRRGKNTWIHGTIPENCVSNWLERSFSGSEEIHAICRNSPSDGRNNDGHLFWFHRIWVGPYLSETYGLPWSLAEYWNCLTIIRNSDDGRNRILLP